MPWQQQAADVLLEVLPNGSWAYRRAVVTTPRQSGKTTLLAPLLLHRGLTRPASKLWLTAQRRQAARDTWLQIVQLIRASPLGPRMEVRESNGSEAVRMPGGSSFGVFAPSEDSLHGTSNAAVALDEAWAFSPFTGQVLLQAILPTFTTTGGQLLVVSTAGTSASTFFRGYVDEGRAAVAADQRDGIAYLEWSLPDDDVGPVLEGLAREATPADRTHALDLVERAHPAAGLTLRRDALEDAASALKDNPGEFLRAYGNRWTETTEAAIPGHLWTRCKAASWPPPEPGHLSLSYDVAMDRSEATISAAWRRADGTLCLDVIDHRPGVAWLPDRLTELAKVWRPLNVPYDPGGPSAEVAPELVRAFASKGGPQLVPITPRQYAAACAVVLGAVEDHRLEHPGSGVLDRSVAIVATRPRGDGFIWSRRGSSGSISPLTAATLAAWGFDYRPEPVAPAAIYRRSR